MVFGSREQNVDFGPAGLRGRAVAPQAPPRDGFPLVGDPLLLLLEREGALGGRLVAGLILFLVGLAGILKVRFDLPELAEPPGVPVVRDIRREAKERQVDRPENPERGPVAQMLNAGRLALGGAVSSVGLAQLRDRGDHPDGQGCQGPTEKDLLPAPGVGIAEQIAQVMRRREQDQSHQHRSDEGEDETLPEKLEGNPVNGQLSKEPQDEEKHVPAPAMGHLRGGRAVLFLVPRAEPISLLLEPVALLAGLLPLLPCASPLGFQLLVFLDPLQRDELRVHLPGASQLPLEGRVCPVVPVRDRGGGLPVALPCLLDVFWTVRVGLPPPLLIDLGHVRSMLVESDESEPRIHRPQASSDLQSRYDATAIMRGAKPLFGRRILLARRWPSFQGQWRPHAPSAGRCARRCLRNLPLHGARENR